MDYDRFGGGMVSEGGAGGGYVGWVFGFVDGLFGGWNIFLLNDVVDRLGHSF